MFIPHHVSHVWCHMSCITCQMSDVRCQMSQVTFVFVLQSGGASCGRVCYQRGLPRLFFILCTVIDHLIKTLIAKPYKLRNMTSDCGYLVIFVPRDRTPAQCTDLTIANIHNIGDFCLIFWHIITNDKTSFQLLGKSLLSTADEFEVINQERKEPGEIVVRNHDETENGKQPRGFQKIQRNQL